MNALDLLDDQYVTVEAIDDIIEDLEEDAMMASVKCSEDDYYGVYGMEVFQTIGIFVVALVFYAIVSLVIPITINNGNASKGFWITA